MAELKSAFREQLIYAAETGLCRLELWFLVAQWAAYMPSDTQDVEGFNKCIQNIVKLAPNIKKPLLSARSTSRTAF